ncbi:Putative linoleate diol synthase with cytochrome P450 domain [Podospora comata]|uniref:Linoleate diol synthase with cytochrome P450 domain n=1 Tax=Podospora comata TaxID=48703 RepID=A0ABY6SCA7_PODCO|nr:Putative linoleate diol synthase with cytochrome P450 domain [Podospora comata]
MSDYNGNGHKASNGTGVTALNGSSSSHGSSSAHQSREGMELVASQAKPRPTLLDLKPTGANRAGVANAFERYGQVMQSSVAPLPNQHGADTFSRSKKWGKLRDDIKQLRLADYKTLLGVVKAKVKGEKIKDDKTMAMEKVIQLVSNLPSNSKTRTELTNSFLSELWYTLEHPPSMYVGEKFQYRQADGSYNNVMFPQLGAAGTSYSRSVAANVVRQGALPDPNLIFESVMKRTEYTEHPNNVSSILWYWASIIIHDLFWTDYRDMSKSKTSSYLDLSPLYGSNQDMQDTIRTFKDGKIKPDCFADKRLLGMPPGVGVFLIMFNRVHNHVAENLARINEDGRFSPPNPNLEGEKKEAAWKKYDNDLFQHARLITSGLYINITLLDYVRNIVNLNRVDTTWTLDPRVETGINVDTKEGAERGTGNVCSAEFNLCYRWHSCISAKDDKWIQDFYYDLFKKPGKDLSIHELIMGFGKFESMIPDDPAERPFNKFQRGPDGKFNDDDLVNCISDAIEDPAGSFGARNVPESMRAVEILGIIQGRRWNVAGLNEFRKHFGLKPYEKFEDINSDPGVAESLRRLYDHPDFVELYPGLVAEERKEPMVPGVGIAPTYTISRVVLSDAVCLVRGDRHYTIDYTPRNLTNWGFNEVQYDLNINHGCVFYKLFLRAFPNHFKYNSVYAHYPMVTPSENSKILKDLKRAHLFDFSRPGRIATPTEVTSYDGAQRILAAEDKFKSTWNAGVAGIRAKASPELSGDAAVHDRHRTTASRSLFTPELGTQIKAFYESLTDKLLTTKSYTLVPGSKFADIVRDIANIVPTHFAASVFGLPLTTKENSKGIYTEHELYAVLQIIASALFVDSEPVKLFPVVEAAKTVAGQLGTLVDKTVKSPKAAKNSVLNTFGVNFIKELKKAGLATHDITWNHVLPTAAALASSQGELFTQAVDYYLSPEGVTHVADIIAIASQPSSSQNDALLLGYVLEGIRLSGSARSHLEATTAGTVTASNGTELHIQPGSKVTINSSTASRDAAYFPEPETVNPRRPLDKYIHFNAGPHAFLGKEISQIALTEMFRALFKRKNVRRAPGPQGELKKVPRADGNGVDYLREDWGALTPFPVTMKVMWDEV